MTLATSDEHTAVGDAISSWARRASVIDIVRDELDKPVDKWTTLFGDLAELGVFGAALPEDLGGADARIIDAAAMVERCGYELVGGPLIPTVVAALALAHSDDERAGDLLDGIIAGRLPVSLGMTADFTTLDAGALDLAHVRGYVDGNALLIGSAATDDAGWRLLPPAVAAVSADEPVTADGLMSVSRLRVSGVAADALVDLPDAEFVSAALSAMLAAYQSGVTRWAVDTAVEYAKVRNQFGAPIGSFQAVKHICADMVCRAERVTAAAWDLARALDEFRDARSAGARSGAQVAGQLAISRYATDILVADLAVPVTQDCIQILGGIGFTFSHPAHLYLRAAMTARSSLDYARRQRVRLARCGGANGIRRSLQVDLSDVEDRRAEVRAAVARFAGLPASQRRAALAESGYLMPHWPAPFGLGASPALQLLIDAEMDAAGVVRPDLVIGAWAIPTILEHGTRAQRDRFVGPTLAGDIVWCQLFSEPEAGSDLAALRTRAVRVDGGWRLSGQKVWTSQAHHAHWGICLARTDSDAPKHKGISYFLVDMTSPGIDIRPLRELTGRANFNEVFLDDVFVPDECVVGEINGGWRLARTTLANERVAMGGSGLGAEMDALFDRIDALGRPLTDAESGRLGTLIADAHIGRVIDARMVTQRLAGHDPGALSNVRKLIGVAHRQSVPEFALQLCGTAGVAGPDAFEAVLQNRCLSIAGGTTQILRTAVAERILGLPRS